MPAHVSSVGPKATPPHPCARHQPATGAGTVLELHGETDLMMCCYMINVHA